MADPRLRDVAERAGVSMATASYVLRSSPGARISPATRSRVRLAADEVGYRWRAPHRITGAVVLVIPERAEQDAPGLVAAVTEQAWARGLATVMLPRTGSTAAETAVALRDEGLRTIGVIEVAHGAASASASAQGRERTVVVDLHHRWATPAEDLTVVVPDDRQVARQVAVALRRAGHEGVVLVAEDRHAHLVALWRDGLAEVVRRQVPVVELGPAPAATGSASLRHALHQPDRPTALVCLLEPGSALSEGPAVQGRGGTGPGDLALVVRGGAAGTPPDGCLRVPFPVTELARAALGTLDGSAASSGPVVRAGQVTRVRFPAEAIPAVPVRAAARSRLHVVDAPASAG